MCQAEKESLELEIVLADLEKEVLERTRELQVAMENADQACLANYEILAWMSDELRAPMNVVINIGELMLVSNMEPAQRKLIKIIPQSVISLLKIVDSAQHSSKCTGEIMLLLDMEYANKMRSDFNGSVFASLVQYYCNDAEQTLCDLEQAAESHDAEKISNLLHLLKGCSANFGASAIVELCNDYSMRIKDQENITQSDVAHMNQVYCDTKTQLLELTGNQSHF